MGIERNQAIAKDNPLKYGLFTVWHGYRILQYNYITLVREVLLKAASRN
ncbi:MAG: hypothetical protein V7K68_31235 [Nostoc sp.]